MPCCVALTQSNDPNNAESQSGINVWFASKASASYDGTVMEFSNKEPAVFTYHLDPHTNAPSDWHVQPSQTALATLGAGADPFCPTLSPPHSLPFQEGRALFRDRFTGTFCMISLVTDGLQDTGAVLDTGESIYETKALAYSYLPGNFQPATSRRGTTQMISQTGKKRKAVV